MKKKIIFSLIIIALIGFGIFIKSYKEDYFLHGNSSEQMKEENLLSMMLETSAESGEYEMVTQSSWPTDGYTFNAELSKCENGGILGWDSTNKVVTMTGSMSDKCYVYFDIAQQMTLAEYVISQYDDVQGNNNIYYHNGTLTNGISDGSYRYSGASSAVNNYVCFGTDDETCPTENLYRIIGVIGDKIKLIKATSLGEMVWDSAESNTWSTSSLNTYLNGTYLDLFSETWKAKIVTTTWKVGGIDDIEVTAATMYTNEMNSTATGTDGLTEYSSKVALMYVHDYGLAASPTAWGVNLYNYDGDDSNGTSISTNDWLFIGSEDVEWLLSRISSHSDFSYRVFSDGSIDSSNNYVSYSYVVRPVFFIESTATYSSGTGTDSDPIRIK